MQWHNLIFSEKPAIRLQRHLLFWLAWWLYFSLCDYLYQQPMQVSKINPLFLYTGSFFVLKIFLLILIYAAACYLFIYTLLPQIQKKRWWRAALSLLLVFTLLLSSAYLLYWNVFPAIDSLFGIKSNLAVSTWFWPVVNFGLLLPVKVIAAAAIIKYIKYWWQKQKEKDRLEKEKINAELQWLKVQVKPGFLFSALNSIYNNAVASSPRAPELLLKLSDLLSYMLYECEQDYVLLEKEIERMKDYIALEKLSNAEPVETGITIKGDMSEKKIAPFMLLPFIENSFKLGNHSPEQHWINMDISVDKNHFTMKLANGMIKQEIENNSFALNGLANVQKRLTLLYPEKHELKISHEEEMQIVLLKIELTESSIIEINTAGEKVMTNAIFEKPTIYATH